MGNDMMEQHSAMAEKQFNYVIIITCKHIKQMKHVRRLFTKRIYQTGDICLTLTD